MRLAHAGCCGQPSSGQGAAGSLQFISSFGRDRGDTRVLRGAIAQLGERLNGIQEVRGSTPLGSTI